MNIHKSLKKRLKKLKTIADNVEGRPFKSDRDKIRIVTEMISEIGEEYGGRTPKKHSYSWIVG